MHAPLTRNIVLLGALSDIGAALTHHAQLKADVRLLAVSRRRRAQPPTDTPQVSYLEGVDLTIESDLQRLAAAAEAKFAEPFSVIHSVGDFWVHKPLIETPFADIVRMVASQVTALMGVARYLTPVMIRNGGGRLVAFSCNSVSYNYPDMSPFTASKAAVETFVKCYANEHAEFNISACALALPTILTPTVKKEKAIEKPDRYIAPEALASYVLDTLLALPAEVNGNVIKLVKHNPDFYHRSYYDRNPRR